jgi:hypothetical protein
MSSLRLDDGSRLLAISVLNDEEALALAESFGAATLLDKVEFGTKACTHHDAVGFTKAG